MLLKTLIKKEILNNLLNLRFSLVYFMCSFLLIGSTIIMLSDFLREYETYTTNRNAYNRRISEMRSFMQHKPIAREPFVTKVFAVGAERDPDRRADIAHESTPDFKGDFKRNPLVNLFPSIDFVFIVGVILSLLIFVLTYDSISGEKEEGTLKVLLSCPVPKDQVLLGKWIGGFVSLTIPFTTSLVVILLVLLFAPNLAISQESWIRILLLFAECILYIAVIFSLSTMVSTICRISATSILALLFVWVFGIAVIPSISTPVAYLLVGPPGVQEAQYAIRKSGVVGWTDMAKKAKADISKKFGGRKRKELSSTEQREWDKLRRDYWLNHMLEVNANIIAESRDLTRNELKIDRIARWICRLSPFGCLQNMAVNLAKTGIYHEKALRNACKSYSSKTLAYSLERYKKGIWRADHTAGPRFTLKDATIADSLTSSLLDIGILFIMGIIFFMGAFMGFSKKSVA